MRVVTVVGARPQFVKASAVSAVLRRSHEEILVHTGQHYDYELSDVFFDELGIPPPDHNLEVGSCDHGAQTGRMLERIEEVLAAEKPDWVIVYGDTNSTLAGAVAAAKLHVPVAHVEAGLRSFNKVMPEELNRVLADHAADLLLCPSETAVTNLAKEGIRNGVKLVGDVMYDALQSAVARAHQKTDILESLSLEKGAYGLATIHRAENTDDPSRLASIVRGLGGLDEPVLFPVHPRTRKAMEEAGLAPAPRVRILDPLGYLDMSRLVEAARVVLTDSGGLQKEAYWLGTPCVTLRDETEWVETVASGWNTLAGTDADAIARAACRPPPPAPRAPLYGGDGKASARCVEALEAAQRERRA
jgi:UDP-GlcNAc3NAcA epimerase